MPVAFPITSFTPHACGRAQALSHCAVAMQELQIHAVNVWSCFVASLLHAWGVAEGCMTSLSTSFYA